MKARSRSLVKDSTKLREALKARWAQVGLTQLQVAEDAQKLGQKSILRQGISRYLNKPYSAGSLNEEQIIFLAWRWEVYVTLMVGRPSKQVEFKVPKIYNEERALENLKKIFPETKIPKK